MIAVTFTSTKNKIIEKDIIIGGNMSATTIEETKEYKEAYQIGKNII